MGGNKHRTFYEVNPSDQTLDSRQRATSVTDSLTSPFSRAVTVKKIATVKFWGGRKQGCSVLSANSFWHRCQEITIVSKGILRKAMLASAVIAAKMSEHISLSPPPKEILSMCYLLGVCPTLE